ncbi:MAG: prepilin-type N-terminal cleavage/methylation domain-containing protein, partial [Phycisphaerales bacterium]|nr:prepilin-type N-terminal cleavage/methylation domain-containing protein [Phycisphaerales bacterium]
MDLMRVTNVKRNRAFSLVELIVVMGILMILIGLVMVGMRAL